MKQNYAHKKQSLFVATVIAFIFLSLPACYTLLKHPTAIKEEYPEAEPNNCKSCHNDSDLWRFHHPQGRFIPGAAFYDPWVYYYEIPWWYESYWFYDDPNNPETIPLHRRSLRPSEDKRRTFKIRGDYTHPSTDVKIKGQNLKSRDKQKGKKDRKSTDQKKRSLRGKRKKGKEDANSKKEKKESSREEEKNKD